MLEQSYLILPPRGLFFKFPRQTKDCHAGLICTARVSILAVVVVQLYFLP